MMNRRDSTLEVKPEPHDFNTGIVHERDYSRQAISLLKSAVWIYFILLIFEGAIRKWLLPGLATPLLVVRDPIAIFIVVQAWRNGLLPFNIYLGGMMFLGFLSISTALFAGHGNLAVAVYGARILLLHFPVIFVIGNVFGRQDVIRIGKAIVWLAIPMTVIIALQYFSPQSAWINLGVGGDTSGSGFNAGANGYYRPSGTFSFTIGIVHFYHLVTCFVLYFWVRSREINRFLLIIVTLCLLAAIPLSIARSLLFGVGVSGMFLLYALLRKPENLYKLLPIGAVLGLALVLLSNTTLFQISMEAFLKRIEHANNIEGGMEGVIGDRYFGGMIGALSSSMDIPFLGRGAGMGSNVGSMLLTGKTSYLISEGEWGRLIGEMGAVMGVAVILIRLGLCAKLTIAGYHRLLRNDFLPWLLLSFCLLIVPQGQWDRPTTLGFAVLIGGLTIASLKFKKQ